MLCMFLQIHRIGVRRTLLCGELLCGVLVVTFGLLEYLPVPDPTDNSVDVTYLVLAIVMRILQAIGASAYTTAAMTLLTTAFPEDTIVMLVRTNIIHVSILEYSYHFESKSLSLYF